MFRTIRIVNVDDAWLAGLFEGEGCLYAHASTGTWQVTIAMCDEDVVRRAHAIAGVGTVRWVRPGRENWSPQWRFTTGARDDIHQMLTRLLPYLGERRTEKANDFFRWYAAGGRSVTSSEFKARNAAQMRAVRARRRAERTADV